MSKEITAGVSIVGDRSLISVFEQRDGEAKIVHLAEEHKTADAPLWFLESILHPKERILKKISRVSIALDSSFVIHHSYPIDTSLNQTEQNEHTHWELATLIPDYRPTEYICDSHVLQTRARDQVAEVLIVALRRAFMFDIQESLKRSGIELHIVDTNYFGAQYAVHGNYPDTRSKMVAILFVAFERIDIGYESNGRLIRYGYTHDASADAAIRQISASVRDQPVNEIYCCGPGASEEMMTLIQEGTGIALTVVNPFKRLTSGPIPREFTSLAGAEYRFAASAGIILRRQ